MDRIITPKNISKKTQGLFVDFGQNSWYSL